MQDMNSVNVTGRLVRDMEVKYSSGGMAIGEFAIAINNRKKVGEEWKDEASFVDCTLFGRQAEAIAQYLLKGKQVAITAKIKQDRWQNKEGQNRSKVGLIADSVVLLGGESKGENIHRSNTSNAEPDDGFGDDDIPF